MSNLGDQGPRRPGDRHCGPGDPEVARLADDVIEVPSVEEYLQPIVPVLPLQLLAYYIAVARGCDIDKPRNLPRASPWNPGILEGILFD